MGIIEELLYSHGKQGNSADISMDYELQSKKGIYKSYIIGKATTTKKTKEREKINNFQNK